MAKSVKSTKVRYVVEVVVETDRPLTKKVIAEGVQAALDASDIPPYRRSRVRKVDLD